MLISYSPTGEPIIIESGGKRYDCTNHKEEFDETNEGGSVRTRTLSNAIEYYSKHKSTIDEMSIIRILTDNNGTYVYNEDGEKIVCTDITETAKSRLKYPKIDIEKTVKIINKDGTTDTQSILADLGDQLQYTITIKNNSDETYDIPFKVIENIDSRLGLKGWDNYGVSDGNNKLTWEIESLVPNEVVKIHYTVEVPYNNDLLGEIILSNGNVEGIATSKIELLIGKKFSKEQKECIVESFEKLKAEGNEKVEREFINEIYREAFNFDLGLNKLANSDIIKYDSKIKTYGGENTLQVKTTKINETSVKPFVFQNFYGLRINYPDGNIPAESIVRAILQWNIKPKYDLNDRAKNLTPDMLLDGDIVLVHTGKTGNTDENLVDKSYIYLNGKLIRKVSETSYEELTGSELKTFLMNIVCDNYVILRPSLKIDEVKNYSVNGVYCSTLLVANDMSNQTSDIIKVEKSNEDASVFKIDEDSIITLDLNGKIVRKKVNNILNFGTFTITDKSGTQGKLSTIYTSPLSSLIINRGILNIENGDIYNAGIDEGNWYAILNDSEDGEKTINLKGGTISSILSSNIPSTTGTGRAIYVRDGNLNMTGGTVKNTASNGYAICSYITKSGDGKIVINDGIITNKNGSAIAIETSSNTFTNGTTVEIYDGTITGTDAGIYAGKGSTGNIKVTGGTIIGEGTYGISKIEGTSGNIEVTGGTIISNTYSAISNKGSGIVKLGDNSNAVSNQTPVLQGKTYGVVSNGGIYFYDGIIKGEDNVFAGNIKGVPNGYSIAYENLGDYNIATLKKELLSVELSESTYEFTGLEIIPDSDTIIVKDKNNNKVSRSGYSVEYKNNINVGTATLVITGVGEYVGIVGTTFEIVDTNPTELIISGELIYGGTLNSTINNLKYENANLEYQWYRNTSKSNIGGEAIQKATQSTLDLTSHAFNKYIYLEVKVSKENYISQTFTSNVTEIIGKRPLIITAGTRSKVYDGEALEDNTYTVSGELPYSHTIQCTMTADSTITNAGTVDNKIERVILIGTKNSDVSEYYDIKTETGKLTVNKRRILVDLNEISKEYDGEELAFKTDDYIITEGNLVNGQNLTISIPITRTEVGETTVELLDTYISIMEDGVDVKDNYDIESIGGLLTITEVSSSILKGDVNLDGNVDSTDLQRLYVHLNGQNSITDANQLLIADVNASGNIDSTDLQRLYIHLNGSSLLENDRKTNK